VELQVAVLPALGGSLEVEAVWLETALAVILAFTSASIS
jgi:hypothetical protein